MLFDPTERNVDPFLFPTRIRTMQELILTLPIHDKDVTMAKTAQVSFIARTARRAAKTHRNNEFGITAPPKQRFVIAMPTNTRAPSPGKVQVRGSWHFPLSTPGLHQGCDSPPHTGKQWPTPLSSTWPDSGASPVRIRNKCMRNHRGPPTRCGTTPSSPSLQLRKGKKEDSPIGGHLGTTIPQTELFLQL